MFSDTLAIEVLGVTPFEHDISLAINADIASTKRLSPTVTLNYHLIDSGSKFQPYVGMSLNYTAFFEGK
ncbi:hypothetical protein A3715_00305 [Oleiphilus sp. HI0009]|nr:hypothetical protein A3715_10675 [Oleiphilus sp. HI0009]KZX82236.1 hypothetical protein A3715_00305 [Oleiphilus sp. HI0009]